MNQIPMNETSPNDLLKNFNGRSLTSIITFTLLAHGLLLIATSGPYLWNSLFGEDSSKLSESERINLAVKESSSAMRRIAERYGIKPQDLGSQFANPNSTPKAEPPKNSANVAPKTESSATPTPEPVEPKSAIEKEIKKALPGPTVPSTDDEDLFK